MSQHESRMIGVFNDTEHVDPHFDMPIFLLYLLHFKAPSYYNTNNQLCMQLLNSNLLISP